MKVLFTILLVFSSLNVFATTYYVDDTGDDANDGLTLGNAKLTIQDVFDNYNLASGDIISVQAGTYSEDHIWPGSDDEGFTIQGAGSTSTIYDGDNTDYWMYLSHPGNDNITIADLKIKDMKASSGAIQFRDLCSGWLIEDVIFENCEATSDRGAAININSTATVSLTVRSCTFTQCTVTTPYDGAAIGIDNSSSSLVVEKCTFYNNEALSTYGDGSAISIEGAMTSCSIENSLFYENTSYRYGVIYDDEGATIMNCTFVDNISTTSYGGLYLTGGVTSDVTNTIITDNSSTDIYVQSGTLNLSYSIYDTHSGATIGSGNSTTSPTFTSAAGDDYSLTSGSEGVDGGTSTGAPADDLTGNSRDATPDIGCYELEMNIWDGSSSSDWKTAANWSDNVVPTTGSVLIPTSGSYTNPPIINEADAVCGSITVEGDAVLTLSSGKLTATGSVSMASTSEIQFDGGELECSGKFSADGILDINSGTLDVNGEFEVGSTLTEQISGGTIEVAGDFDGASEGDGDFTPSGGTVILNGSSGTTLDNHSSATFYNLTLDQAGVKSSSGSITVTNDFTINSGSQLTQSANRLTLAGNVDISGTLNHSGGNDIYLTGSSKTLSGTGTQTTANYMLEAGSNYNLTDDWSINSLETWTGGATFSVATTKTLTLASTFYTRTNANITLTGSANMTIGGDAWMASEAGSMFNLNSGILDLNGANAYMCGGSGTFNANSGTINISSANSTINGTFNEGTSTVNFDGSAQNVPAETYSNLTISNAGTKTASGNIDVNGDLTTAATATCKLDMSTYDLNVAGDLSVGATDGLDASDASCLVTIDGSSDQTITHAGNTAGGGTENIFFDDFTSPDAGWTSGAISGSNSWATGVLQGAQEDPSTDYTSTNTDNKVYGQGMSASSGDGLSDYYDSSNEWLKTPSIDCSGHTNISLSFARHAYFESCCDESYVEISTDNSAWTDLSETLRPTDGSWTVRTIDISAIADGDASIWIRWRSDSDGSVAKGGWNIDDVTISGDAPATTGSELTDLTISKSGGDLILSSTLEIEGTITMTTGDINLNGNNIDLMSTGSISGETNTSRIFGSSGVITTTRSINAPSALDAGGMGLAITSSANFGSTTIYRGHAAQTGLGNTSIERYYSISPTTNTGLDATIVINYFDNELGTHNESNLALYRSTDGGTTWTWRGGTVNTGANTITLTEIDAFSLWVPSDEVAEPLPIKLVTFYGEKDGRNNLLRWTTASEKNNDYFTIEKTTDGNTFYEVGRRQGAGNSIYHTSYELTDVNIESTLNYYRLVQTDFDGKKEYSKLISIDNRNSEETERKLIQITNTWGQEINEDYIGIAIYIYSDGSVEKIFQN